VNPQQQPDDPIKHVVLLMFENHSFDQMLGCFQHVYPQLDGVDPNSSRVNLCNGQKYEQQETSERQMILDRRHEVNHVAVQLQHHNSGFVQDFFDANKNDKKLTPNKLDQQCHFVMGYYKLDFLPALHRLVRDFLICDHWLSSIPGPTWTNRFFALSGTSSGKVNMPEVTRYEEDDHGEEKAMDLDVLALKAQPPMPPTGPAGGHRSRQSPPHPHRDPRGKHGRIRAPGRPPIRVPAAGRVDRGHRDRVAGEQGQHERVVSQLRRGGTP